MRNVKNSVFAIGLISLTFSFLIIGEESAFAGKKLRKFYLTRHEVTGSQALTACANKFHMASLWEIFNISGLQYDTQNGLTLDDSGSGPPTSSMGWVRTGWFVTMLPE